MPELGMCTMRGGWRSKRVMTPIAGLTEKAMLLLAKKKYARKARYGFVNGREPVNYVRDIRQRFEAYVELGREIATVRRVPLQQSTPGPLVDVWPGG